MSRGVSVEGSANPVSLPTELFKKDPADVDGATGYCSEDTDEELPDMVGRLTRLSQGTL